MIFPELFSLINIKDLDRVEILKSSGSVLFWNRGTGSVLHLVTKRPSFTDELQVNAEMTSDASSVDGGMSHFASAACSAEQYAMRISGGYRNAGNTINTDGVLPHSQYHDFSLTGSFGIKTIDEQSLFFSYQRSQAEDTGIPGGSAFGATAAVRYTLAPPRTFWIRVQYSKHDFKTPSYYFSNVFARKLIGMSRLFKVRQWQWRRMLFTQRQVPKWNSKIVPMDRSSSYCRRWSMGTRIRQPKRKKILKLQTRLSENAQFPHRNILAEASMHKMNGTWYPTNWRWR